jgi:hypothetical protein
VKEVEGCETPANDEGVLPKKSGKHKKLQANLSIAVNFSRHAAGPV